LIFTGAFGKIVGVVDKELPHRNVNVIHKSQKMTKIVAVVNQKGGTGKTTVSSNIIHAARRVGLRALAADLDKQGSLSLAFLPAADAAPGLMAHELFTAAPLTAPESIADDLSIIRADKSLLAKCVKADPAATAAAAKRLREAAQEFDLCVIDTPGSLGEDATTYAALMAADFVVCPFQVGLSEIAALEDLWRHLGAVRKSVNPKLKLLGLLPCKINTRSRQERDFLASLRKTYGSAILPHVLAERAPVKQAVARRVAVWQGTRGDSHMKAGQEWLAACESILAGVGVTK
jgi:chromosome partitioning protein